MSEATSRKYRVVHSPYFRPEAPRDGDIGEFASEINDGRVIVLQFPQGIYHFLKREVEEVKDDAGTGDGDLGP